MRALIYSGPSGGEVVEIVRLNECNSVWSVNRPKSWKGCYYVYEVSVYHPSTLQIEKCIANDPYARGLSGNRKQTFLVNLDSDDMKPQKWDDLADEKPDIADFSDISIYELHIRDFSSTVHPDIQGGYLAFTSQMRAKSMLKNLSRDKDKVDGSSIFVYGEGWDYGEVANNGRGVDASQFNLAGSGIGSFDDRI